MFLERHTKDGMKESMEYAHERSGLGGGGGGVFGFPKCTK